MSTQLRITQVLATDRFAGTERYVVEVGAELSRRGHAVQVVGGEPVAMRRLLPPAVRWRAGGSARTALAALATGGRCDVVHSHITRADFVAAMAAPLTGGARISTRHITARRGYSPLAASLAGPVRRGLRREIAVSNFVATTVETAVDEVLVNGVAPVPDQPGPRERTVLVAQRLAAEKGTDVALRAFARSGLARQGWQLLVAGDGDQRAALERQAAGLDGVRFLGWVDDLQPLLASAGLLLAPAPAEPCGLTVLEAMAHGLPVVAAGSGGHLETVGREPGAALFPAGDEGGAATQLSRLATDETGRDRYARSLRDLQRRELTLARHVDRLEEIYARACARPGRGRSAPGRS